MNKKPGHRYQPIENYAIIGDLRTMALVGLNGSIDFMCFPHFDSPTIFASLLDAEKGGAFRISPSSDDVKFKQMYFPSTNVLLTRFSLPEGIGEMIDFMPVAEGSKKSILIRTVENIKGEIPYRMVCAPRFDYGRTKHKISKKGGAIFFEGESSSPLTLKLTSSVPLAVREKDGMAEFTLMPGKKAVFILEAYADDGDGLTQSSGFVEKALDDTVSYWKQWIGKSNYRGRWREMVDRSALALKLMISSKYGSLVAAPTFGLPEQVGGDKNWDYRYSWIRDTAFTIHSLMLLGYTSEAEAFMKWVSDICRNLKGNDTLKIMYRIDGTSDLKEETLDNFEGYRQSSPVRIGNAAYKQQQMDIFGELMDSIYIFNKYIQPVSHDTWQYLTRLINWVAENWHRKGHGIWESRGSKKEYLYSRFMCWVGLDRAIHLAANRSLPHPPEWIKARDEIYASVFEDFWDGKRKAFVAFKGSSDVDASTLMMPLVRFIGPKDPRWLSTLECIEKDLVVDALVYRYKTKGRKGSDSGEGTFSLCSFLYVECLSRAGKLEKALFNFEKMLGFANHVGLYSEQLGLQGEHLGNFPQAFTHLALISAACDLDKRLGG